MLSSFVVSSVSNVLLQTNSDVTSHLLNSSTAQTHCCKMVKLRNFDFDAEIWKIF